MAGGKVLLAVEWDKHAVETYRLNFPDTSIYHGDIAKLSVEECCALARVKPGELDILDGSPPCQGFSTAGKRDFNDDRNQLFREFVRLLKGLQPKVFVMENVSGLVKGKMKLIFADMLRSLKGVGYQVKARLLNAMYYGVPQSRVRMIFVGARVGLPGHPKAIAKVQTTRQAIGHLPEGIKGKHQPQVIAAWHKSKPGQALRRACRYVGSFQSCRIDPNRVSPTMVKNHYHWHYAVPRLLTKVEAGLLASYPESYQWPGTRENTKNQIGNSVPPLFMKAIAEHIRDKILNGN